MKTAHSTHPAPFTRSAHGSRRSRVLAPFLAAALTLTLSLLAPTGARADDPVYIWGTTGTGNWADTANWLYSDTWPYDSVDPANETPGGLANKQSFAYIDNGGTAVVSSETDHVDWVTVGFDDDSGVPSAATHGDGTLVVNGDGVLNITRAFYKKL